MVFIGFAFLTYGFQLLGKFQLLGLPLWFINYAADCCCLPIVLFLAQRLIWVIKRDSTIQITLPQIILVTIYISLVFEWLLPHYSKKYTADWLDVGMYACGATLFYYWQKMCFAPKTTLQ